MEEARATLDQPFAVSVWVPGDPCSGAEDVGNGPVQGVGMRRDCPVCDLLLKGRTGAGEEVPKDGVGAAGVWVAVVIPTEAVVQGRLLRDFPDVRDEGPVVLPAAFQSYSVRCPLTGL